MSKSHTEKHIFRLLIVIGGGITGAAIINIFILPKTEASVEFYGSIMGLAFDTGVFLGIGLIWLANKLGISI